MNCFNFSVKLDEAQRNYNVKYHPLVCRNFIETFQLDGSISEGILNLSKDDLGDLELIQDYDEVLDVSHLFWRRKGDHEWNLSFYEFSRSIYPYVSYEKPTRFKVFLQK
jgi:hypothetical protein